MDTWTIGFILILAKYQCCYCRSEHTFRETAKFGWAYQVGFRIVQVIERKWLCEYYVSIQDMQRSTRLSSCTSLVQPLYAPTDSNNEKEPYYINCMYR